MKRRRGQLTRQIVLEAALELVDREGADALSMRKLGDELSVQAMSLYTYVANRDHLLDGIAEVMVQALRPPRRPRTWAAAVRAFAIAIRETAKAHPQAFLLVGMRPLRTPAALTPIETLLDQLQAAGFRPPHAVAAYRLVASYARGFALAELQGFTLDAAGPDDHDRPAIDAARHGGTAHDHDEAFRLGIETIIAGLRNTVASGKAKQ